MAADIIARNLDFVRQQETLIFMGDYGASMTKVLSINETDRAAQIASVQATMLANDTAAEAYATNAGYPAPTVLTFAQKQILYAQQGGQVPLTSAPS